MILPTYAGKITADELTIQTDQGEINQANQTVARWKQQVASDELQATCEAQGVSYFAGCGQGTGLVGQGQVYQVRLTELQNDQAALTSAQTQATATRNRLSPQIQSAQADLSQARQQEQADYATAQTRYGQDDGLIARWLALGELERTSSGIRTEVWLLEGLIIAIDLAAVIAKLKFEEPPSYNGVLEARRKKVALRAAMHEEDAADAIELRRAGREAKADIHQAWLDAQVHVALIAIAAWMRVAQWRIDGWTAGQTGGQQSRTSDASSGWQPPPRRGRQRWHGTAGAAPIKGQSLSSYVDVMRPHERMPIAMVPALRQMAWIGVGLQPRLAARCCWRGQRTQR